MLQQDASLTLAGDANTNIRFIGFNLTKEPFDNPKVRQAIAAVVDRTAMLGPTVFGHGTPTETLFPPDFWAALQQEIPAPDIEAAKQLLADAGHPDGFSTTITSWSQYSFLSNAAVVLQEQLTQIGIEAELNLVENGAMSDRSTRRKVYDIAVTGESAYVDPNTLILPNFKSGEAGNFVGYSNPKADELIEQGIAVERSGGASQDLPGFAAGAVGGSALGQPLHRQPVRGDEELRQGIHPHPDRIQHRLPRDLARPGVAG